MEIWFTSDYHLDHFNIISYCDRPFMPKDIGNGDESVISKALARMFNTIVKNYNSMVGRNDLVYNLGDISLRGSENLSWYKRTIGLLNGKKHLILGNHDKLNPFSYVDAGFETVHTALHLELLDLYLAHDPAMSNVRSDKLWICGHVHNLFKTQKNVINAGVDVWEFKPVNLSKIMELGKEMGY